MAAKKKKKAVGKNGKHPGGRPTKYSLDMVKRTREYIDSCVDTVQEEAVQMNEQHQPTKFQSYLKVNIPTIEGLSLYLDISVSVLYLWRDEHEEFSEVIRNLLAKQASMLVGNGLSGRYNSTIAKVLLSKHGYKEATEVEEHVTHKIDIDAMLKKAYGNENE